MAASSCRRQSAAAPQASLQTFTNLALNQSAGGSAIWNLQAVSAAFDKNQGLAHLKEPRMRFYKHGRLASTLKADSGLLYTQTQNVHMQGRVVATSLKDKTVLHTSVLDYVSKTKTFISHVPVTILRPSGIAHGDGLEANSDFSRIKLFHQKSVIQGKKS